MPRQIAFTRGVPGVVHQHEIAVPLRRLRLQDRAGQMAGSNGLAACGDVRGAARQASADRV
ncbi:hypothetical protein [Dyella sp.]|uniref:hypothetical protein n=1 Tax=Dyella sp. TaxID=1869338 RepID=UPI002843E6C8|nr:hypothetical protein [Dyella sp.]MDR3446585.1 hypothetical protein [Dyella sp.]